LTGRAGSRLDARGELADPLVVDSAQQKLMRGTPPPELARIRAPGSPSTPRRAPLRKNTVDGRTSTARSARCWSGGRMREFLRP
jgi:hypothetical protein